jgi:hypothetical protein
MIVSDYILRDLQKDIRPERVSGGLDAIIKDTARLIKFSLAFVFYNIGVQIGSSVADCIEQEKTGLVNLNIKYRKNSESNPGVELLT